MADIHAKKMAQRQVQMTRTVTKTCIKCARSFPEDQFLDKRTGKAVKMCDPCRNASRISHKKKRMREAAAKAAKGEADKKARIEASLAQEFPSPSPAPVVASSPAQAAQSTPYFPSPTSDTSPGRMLMQNLSNVAKQKQCYPDPEPMPKQDGMYPAPGTMNGENEMHPQHRHSTSFADFQSRFGEHGTPSPIRSRFASSTPASPFLHDDNTHENLLAKFCASPKKKSGNAHGQDVGVSIAVPRFEMHRAPLGQMERKPDDVLITPAVESGLNSDGNPPGGQHYANLHFDQAFGDGDVVRVDMSIVCRFTKHRTHN